MVLQDNLSKEVSIARSKAVVLAEEAGEATNGGE